jgi:3-mercaptopyruvate sulfurtransferase SseA
VTRELQERGHRNARALTGGWRAWEAAGRPVEPRPPDDGRQERPAA